MRELQEVLALYSEYVQLQQKKNLLGNKADLALEGQERLRQLIWLAQRVQALDGQLSSADREIQRRMRASGMSPREAGWDEWLTTEEAEALRAIDGRRQAIVFELKLMVESFYYVGARFRAVLRQLPALHTFECVGVRDVRNHLVEHPEGAASGFTQQSWSWGGEEGVRLKPYRDPRRGNECIDRGFYVNLRELRTSLESALIKALGNAALAG